MEKRKEGRMEGGRGERKREGGGKERGGKERKVCMQFPMAFNYSLLRLPNGSNILKLGNT